METCQISMRNHVQVPPAPWSGEGTAPFSSDGPLTDVVQSSCLGCDEQSTLASHQCGTWHVAWPGLSLQHTWSWDEQDARGAVSAPGSLCHPGFGEHGFCNKRIILRALPWLVLSRR